MLAKRVVSLAWLLLPTLAVAQASAPAAGAPDPMNAAAPVPALPDVAAMAGYQPYQNQKVVPWRQSNADVTPGKAGAGAVDPHAGHRMPSSSGPASAPEAGHGHHAH